MLEKAPNKAKMPSTVNEKVVHRYLTTTELDDTRLSVLQRMLRDPDDIASQSLTENDTDAGANDVSTDVSTISRLIDDGDVDSVETASAFAELQSIKSTLRRGVMLPRA